MKTSKSLKKIQCVGTIILFIVAQVFVFKLIDVVQMFGAGTLTGFFVLFNQMISIVYIIGIEVLCYILIKDAFGKSKAVELKTHK